eukprot:Nitzschia sp. Nitz4//scaffold13_size275219//271069//272811//NITZ4_000932-RA/size275219-processed-gene-0.174-mRNA-1//-1//CDS//3329536188//7905//frame0
MMSTPLLPEAEDSFPLQSTPLSYAPSKGAMTGYRTIDSDLKIEEDEIEGQSLVDSEDLHKTTVSQTFVHLLKGYLGAGCLSLPWAVSILGLFWGSVAILFMAFWSSSNCWTIVKLKRFIERETAANVDERSEASSVTTNTQVTYAAVGEYFYGTKFETYVSACVCIQQLAICTVFISFVGENLLAVMEQNGIRFMATHAGVMTLELPFVLVLSLIPNLKSLSPVMSAGTALLVVTFMALGAIIIKEWDKRPTDPLEFNLEGAPLALCAILYSYEGINLILPVESAMLEPQYFTAPFLLAMTCVALILASFAVICVVTFGKVTNGSMTAFLVDEYPDNPEITWLLMIANTAVSLSVLLTYPLQLFPALELLAPSFSSFLAQDNGDLDDEDDLSAFEPLPPLPEHDVADIEEWEDHQYNAETVTTKNDDDTRDAESNSVAYSAITSLQSVMPEMTMPGDSPLLRILLVMLTYSVAVAVPNVQALISLAGALAGSSTALLIPPMLELAWIEHVEVSEADNDVSSVRNETSWTMLLPGTENFGLGKWWFEKLKCYVLLVLGFIFFGVGTYSSLADIIKIYTSKV